MILSIVIPAYNEEQAIESICRRTLDARQTIIDKTPVDAVEIIVVSDGSSDKTVERAKKFEEIKLIAYEKNRGYGTAIKTGFEASKGDLVSFLDADGTCEPLFFVDLVNLMAEKNADVVLGSRMGPDSEMPKIRRLGNIFFRTLINLIAHVNIQDSASGMRVIKRSALEKLYPLPDGLHFTPAMSCRAVLDKNLVIAEKPMPYKERIGRSKLGVVRDGIRFLKVIIEIALTYKPFSFFGYVATFCMAAALAYGIRPMVFYFSNRYVEDYMIYRIVSITTLGGVGMNLFVTGIICQRITGLFNPYENPRLKPTMALMEKVVFRRPAITGVVFFVLAAVLNHDIIRQYVTTGRIVSPNPAHTHWVFLITGAFLVMISVQFFSFTMLNRIVRLLKEKQDFLMSLRKKEE